MKWIRYVLGGFVSLVLHSWVISAQPVVKAPLTVALDMPAQSSQVQLQFVATMPETKPEKSVTSDLPPKVEPRVEQPAEKPLEKTFSDTKITPVTKVVPEKNVAPVKTPVRSKNNDVAPSRKKQHTPPIKKKTDVASKPKEKSKKQEKKSPNKKVTKPKEKKPVVKKQDDKKVNKNDDVSTKTTPSAKLPAMNTVPQQGANAAPALVAKPSFKMTPKRPHYPRIARRKGLEGTVMLEVWLDNKGEKTNVTLLKTSGHQILDKAAFAAVNQWQFEPHTVDGTTLPSRLHIPIRFNLD